MKHERHLSPMPSIDYLSARILVKLTEFVILQYHNFLFKNRRIMTLPLWVFAWNPVHFWVWDIFQIGINGLPCEDPAINSILWGHNDMCTLSKTSGGIQVSHEFQIVTPLPSFDFPIHYPSQDKKGNTCLAASLTAFSKTSMFLFIRSRASSFGTGVSVPFGNITACSYTAAMKVSRAPTLRTKRVKTAPYFGKYDVIIATV